jgi:transposase
MSKRTNVVAISTIGIDTGKTTLHLVCLDEKGAIVLREKIAQHRIAARLVNVPPCLVGIEAGMATHYMARELVALGHDVKQVPPAFAKPVSTGAQERLPRRPRGRGGSATPFDTLRSDKD